MRGNYDMRIIYTNFDGFICKKLELIDILNDRNPNIVSDRN